MNVWNMSVPLLSQIQPNRADVGDWGEVIKIKMVNIQTLTQHTTYSYNNNDFLKYTLFNKKLKCVGVCKLKFATKLLMNLNWVKTNEV